MVTSPRYIFIIICVFCFSPVFGQLVYYQDMFKGGVTGGGYNPGYSDIPGEIELYIEPGSTIRRALLFVGVYHAADASREVMVNGSPVTLSSASGFLSVPFTMWYNIMPTPWFVRSLALDISDLVSIGISGTTTVTIEPPSGQPSISTGEGRYVEYYLLVAYENENMDMVNTFALVNEINCAAEMDYSIASLNPIDTTKHMGMAVHGSHFCNTEWDGSYVEVNDQVIGLIGGKDENNETLCTGSTGTFYYQNQELFGLSDDTANSTVEGSDALADISTYLTSPNVLEVRLDYQVDFPPNSPWSNPIWQLFFAYTSTCAAFETTLTERVKMCASDSTVQLEATGGNTYEWWPADNLSCTDCPNPEYSGTESANYHVQIWNNDSCSKILPVRIDVEDVTESASLATTVATCSENDGTLAIESVSGGQSPYYFNIGENWVTNPTAFDSLEAGDYTLTIRDQNECYYQQDFFIAEENPAHAAFTANPQSGTEPLVVQFTNESTGTNQYQWSFQSQVLDTVDFSHTFDSAGSYPVQLIAWYNEPHCADTAMATIIVNPAPPDYSHSIFMPTLHNPQNGDFLIKTSNVQRVEFVLYNTIGQQILSTERDVNDGVNGLFNGSHLARGYYFFRLKYWDVKGLEFSESGKVLLVR